LFVSTRSTCLSSTYCVLDDLLIFLSVSIFLSTVLHVLSRIISKSVRFSCLLCLITLSFFVRCLMSVFATICTTIYVVCLVSICLPLCTSVFLSFYLSVCLSVCVFMSACGLLSVCGISVCPPACLPICFCLPACQSACLPFWFCLPVCQSACLPIWFCLPACQSVCLPICLSTVYVCLSVCQSVCLDNSPSLCIPGSLTPRPYFARF
jgi:hypothetical protein